MTTSTRREARVIDMGLVETVEVLGPTLGFVTPLDEGGGDAPCVLRGEIPPGGIVPLHSHAEPETFYLLSGNVEALAGDRWVGVEAGEVFQVPGGARHAFRNTAHAPVTMLITTTASMGRFFHEVAQLINQSGGGPEGAQQTFAAAAERHGHWVAGPEENAAIGLRLA